MTEPNFYTPPAADAAAPLPARGDRPEYRAPRALGTITVLLLGFSLLSSVFSAVTDWYEIDLLDRSASGLSNGDAALNQGVQATAAMLMLTALCATGLAFILFTRRTSLNARALGARYLTHTVASTVYWWFVPIASLFKPYAVVVELWQALAPKSGRERWDGGR